MFVQQVQALRKQGDNMKNIIKLKFCILLTLCTIFVFSDHGGASVVMANTPVTVNSEDVPEVTFTPAQIFENNADAVFTIYTSFNNISFSPKGSGFFVCSTGIAVTNHHVIAGWPYASIRTHSGDEFYISGYYSYDINNDLVILQVVGEDFPYLTIGDSDALRIGESVYTIGSPLGYHNTFSTGIISRFDDMLDLGIYRLYGMIQITAPISGGSSGGALLNNLGQVIGITTAGYTSALAQALNFAVPISRIDLTDIKEGQYYSLPINGTLSMSNSVLFGYWIWIAGYYNFNEDGTGSRLWNNFSDTFYWHLINNVLILTVHDYPDYPYYFEERWMVLELEDDMITVGGALLMRTGEELFHLSDEDERPVLVGTWDWEGGWYTFNDDGTGGRVWSGVAATFHWDVVGGMIILTFPRAQEEQWQVNIINDDSIIVGGALFTRI